MKTADRKAAVAAYKERKATPGIFAVRCLATGDVWIGESRNIDSQQNGIWFALRQGSHMNRELQAAWRTHGPEAFVFEQLERLEPEDVTYVLRSQLRERATFWLNKAGARKL